MKSKLSLHFLPLIVAFCPTLATNTNAGISLGLNTPVTQNFTAPALISSGTATAVNMVTSLPGWTFSETATNGNTTYAANDGSSNSGDTWSYGTTSTTDRAFGSLRDINLVSTFGAVFTRNIATPGIFDIYIKITYIGEQWRLGTLGRTDQLDFEFSTDATSLTTGTWTDFDALDFTAPVSTGTANSALNGNLAANQTAVSPSSTFTVSVANGADFWIRWTDFNATGADDGLAVDNFSITALPEPSTTTLFGALGVAMLLRRRR